MLAWQQHVFLTWAEADVLLLYLLLVKFCRYREKGNESLAKRKKHIFLIFFPNVNQCSSWNKWGQREKNQHPVQNFMPVWSNFQNKCADAEKFCLWGQKQVTSTPVTSSSSLHFGQLHPFWSGTSEQSPQRWWLCLSWHGWGWTWEEWEHRHALGFLLWSRCLLAMKWWCITSALHTHWPSLNVHSEQAVFLGHASCNAE